MVAGICLSILLLALILGRIDWVYERMVTGKPGLPDLCFFHSTTGLPCPGCGLTRSFVTAGRGDLGLSLYFHRFGWLLIIYTFLQLMRHAGWLAFATRRLLIERLGLWLDRGLIPIGVILMINWFYNLARIFNFIT
jgi:hypothetical protein